MKPLVTLLALVLLASPARADISIELPELVGTFTEDFTVQLEIDAPIESDAFAIHLTGRTICGAYFECGTFDYEFRGADMQIRLHNEESPDDSRCISTDPLPFSPIEWIATPRFKEAVPGTSQRILFQGGKVYASVFLGDRSSNSCGGFMGQACPATEIFSAVLVIEETVPTHEDSWSRVKAMYEE